MSLSIEDSIRANIHRYARNSDTFRKVEVGEFSDLPNEEDEILGHYHSAKEQIIFGLRYLYIEDKISWKHVAYTQITDVEILLSETNNKHSANGVILSLKSDVQLQIAVTGGTEKLRDAWMMYDFLRKIMNRIKQG